MVGEGVHGAVQGLNRLNNAKQNESKTGSNEQKKKKESPRENYQRCGAGRGRLRVSGVPKKKERAGNAEKSRAHLSLSKRSWHEKETRKNGEALQGEGGLFARKRWKPWETMAEGKSRKQNPSTGGDNHVDSHSIVPSFRQRGGEKFMRRKRGGCEASLDHWTMGASKNEGNGETKEGSEQPDTFCLGQGGRTGRAETRQRVPKGVSVVSGERGTWGRNLQGSGSTRAVVRLGGRLGSQQAKKNLKWGAKSLPRDTK